MSYFFLQPVAPTYSGVIEQETVQVQDATTNTTQAALVVEQMDLTLYDVHIFEQDAQNNWNPVGSTVGLES